jgi:hypothetical protein
MTEDVKQEFKRIYSILKCKANCASAGTPSLPLNSIQYNTNSLFDGDALATRIAASGNTFIGRDRGGNITSGLDISNDVLSLGILEGSYLTQADPDNDLVAYVGVGLLTGSDDNTVSLNTYNTSTGDQATFRTTLNSIPGIDYEVTGQAYNGTHGATFSLNNLNSTLNFSPDDGTTTFRTANTATYSSLSSDNGVGNPSYAMMEVNKFSIQKGNGGTQRYFLADIAGSQYGIGDLDAVVGNGTYITIDDLTELVKISNVPTYASDALAIIGGLTSGNLYKTTTLGITSLNIVP